VKLSAARGCPAIGWSLNATRAVPNASTSHPSLSIRWRLLHAVVPSQPHQGKSCESSRAIGDRYPRAIGDAILVLSGTGIEHNVLALRFFSRS
jgi:hypothetical protein